ncbi:G-protein coupled receptor Mth2 [Acyrthosiphon pisum]|uniref:G-protein coupled receptors family 2 profile 2 domain-containing protein n=1 Tax=Acyrthosiphon pisum TaxID=7029 RepID=A0A8R2A5D7_ACYPI|nr:G-protein coupled receptor Mth2 [Acyrthosiphon pisum]|eukprot:XP_001951628.2 PREDICTED: G-protein coupled receptor Mth2 [Acyrthosiphon pisum]
MGRRPLPWLLPLLLAAAFANEQCPMNVSRPAPENAYQVNDVLWVGEPNKSYTPAAYRPVQGGGFVLCTCETGACIRKCCPENWAYVDGGKCSELNASLGVKFEVPRLVNENGTVSAYETGLFHLVYGKLTCGDKYLLTPSLNKTDSFQITKTGWLLNESGAIIAPPDKFCLESFSTDNFQTLPVVCSPELENEATGGNIFYTIGMILSLPFLFSTFLVYALIRDLRNLHGKSLMCHVATLMVAYTSLITVQFVTNTVNEEWCVFLAYAVQFSFLASFFWLNVMCFDLWWTFSGFRPLRGNIQEHEAKKFIIYSIYAWGGTALITIITYGTEEYLPASAIRPDFGIRSCWFASFTATLLYFYGPIGILLFSNLLMFIHTAIMIVKHMKDARVLNGSESRRNVDHEKQRFMLYLKLFIVMGVTWLAEIISWASGSNGSEKYWYVTDIGNSLQGVLIFLIFVCKKRVFKFIKQKTLSAISTF